MAVLRSTSPGQLGKYVIPTIDIIKSGSVSTATKTYKLKKSKFNEDAIEKFAELGMKGSSFQKDALLIPLETTDSKKQFIEIGTLNKPNVKYNLGDMAEGVVGAAITARFIYKNRNINAQLVYGVLRALAKSGVTNYPGKKGKQVEKTFKSANQNPKVMDDVRCFISLAEVNMMALLAKNNESLIKEYVDSAVKYANSNNVKKWSKLVYENNRYDKIEVLSDGLGGQKTTKVDVSVKITNDEGKLLPVDILVSLKAGDVKQFGQVSGAEFVKQEELWEQLFGYSSVIKPLEKKYDKLMFMDKQPDEAVYLVYEKVNQQLNQDLRGNKSNEILKKLSSAINYFATLNEDFVSLVQVGGGKAKVYKFDDIYSKLVNREYRSSIKTGASGLPTITISSGNDDLIQFRVKQEFKSDGKPYIRNYVEKLSLLGELLAESL
jgi:hypothetical protein|tara:strand:+ start:50 stop:1354 length:1305 start_codon:yes stop_codon:yes gene_type:complete